MSIWFSIQKQAFKDTRELVRLDSWGRIFMTVGMIVGPIFAGWCLSAIFHVSWISYSFIALVLLASIIYIWKSFSIPLRRIREKDEEIGRLQHKLDEFSKPVASDMSLILHEGVAIQSVGPDWLKEGYTISVENVGSRALNNCQLYWDSSRPGYPLTRKQFIPSSHPFSLRIGEPKHFHIIWVQRGTPSEHGEPTTYWSGEDTDPNYGQPVLTAGDYDFVIKAISADTNPVSLDMRFWHDEIGWHLEENLTTMADSAKPPTG